MIDKLEREIRIENDDGENKLTRPKEKKEKKKKRLYISFTCRSVQIVNPAREGFLQCCRDDRRADDSQRNVATFPLEQLFSKRLGVCVRVWALTYQPFLFNEK